MTVEQRQSARQDISQGCGRIGGGSLPLSWRQ